MREEARAKNDVTYNNTVRGVMDGRKSHMHSHGFDIYIYICIFSVTSAV